MRRIDPLAIDQELHLAGTFFPVGFQLRIATNSQSVLDAAEESWGHFEPQFECPPVEFRILVRPEGDVCRKADHHAQGHLYAVIGDAHNFAVLDLRSLSASMFVSERTAADRSRLRWFFVESLAYALLAQRYIVPVHCACVARDDVGILLCGPSGAGKSTLAYACARAGWTYVADDCVFLLPGFCESIAIGRCRQIRFRPDAPGIFPELSGLLAHERPNGRMSIEVPVSALSGIRTGVRVAVGGVAFLERGEVESASLEPVDAADAAARLLADMPSYGPEVNAMHEATVRRLAESRTFRLRYRTLDDAVDAVGQAIRPAAGFQPARRLKGGGSQDWLPHKP